MYCTWQLHMYMYTCTCIHVHACGSGDYVWVEHNNHAQNSKQGMSKISPRTVTMIDCSMFCVHYGKEFT